MDSSLERTREFRLIFTCYDLLPQSPQGGSQCVIFHICHDLVYGLVLGRRDLWRLLSFRDDGLLQRCLNQLQMGYGGMAKERIDTLNNHWL